MYITISSGDYNLIQAFCKWIEQMLNCICQHFLWLNRGKTEVTVLLRWHFEDKGTCVSAGFGKTWGSIHIHLLQTPRELHVRCNCQLF